MNSKLGLKLSVLITCLCAPLMASAAETGWVNVINVGGQSTHLYIVLSTQVGEPTCPSNRVLLLAATPDTEVGDAQKRLYAAMLAAMNSGGKVFLYLSGCYGGYPTMSANDPWFAAGP